MKRFRKLAAWLLGGLAAAVIVILIAAALLVRSQWFGGHLRERIVREAENATGGRVELGGFSFNWRALRAEARSLVIHGAEGPDEPPFFRARSVAVGLRIVSVFRRDVDLDVLELEAPEVYIAVYPDGRTNVPKPRPPRRGPNPVEQFLKLAVREFRIRDGQVQLNERRIPLDLRAGRLRMDWFYHAAGPRYEGNVTCHDLVLTRPALLARGMDATLHVSLFGDRVEIASARMAAGGAEMRVRGRLENWSAPRAEFRFEGGVELAQLHPALLGPLERRGRLVLRAGALRFSRGSGLEVEARAAASGIAVRAAGMRLGDVRAAGDVRLRRDQLEVSDLHVAALGGSAAGRLELTAWRELRLVGEVRGLSLAEVARLRGASGLPLSGRISGPVEVAAELRNGGLTNTRAVARLSVSAEAGELPVQGSVEAVYDQRARRVEMHRAWLATPSSRLEFNGVFGSSVRLALQTTSLKELAALVSWTSATKPPALPVGLGADGHARFDGVIRGDWTAPAISGRLTAARVRWRQRELRRIAAEIRASAGEFSVENLLVERGTARYQGRFRLRLANWRLAETSPVAGEFSITGEPLEEWITPAGKQLEVAGIASGHVTLGGSLAEPQASARLQVEQPAIGGRKFSRARAELRYAGRTLELLSADVASSEAQIRARGTWAFKDDYRSGTVRLEAALKDASVARWSALTGLPRTLDAAAALEVAAELRVAALRPQLAALRGALRLTGIQLNGDRTGDLEARAETASGIVHIHAGGNLFGAGWSGQTWWGIEPPHAVRGELRFERLPLRALAALRPGGGKTAGATPVTGLTTGVIRFEGAGLDPRNWKGRLELAALEAAPANTAAAGDKVRFRNDGPVTLAWEGGALRVERARLTGPGTLMEITGTVLLTERREAYRLRLRGETNLAILETFQPDLTASGSATVDTTIRGALTNPEIYGRLEFRNASFYLRGIPNGLDKATGTVAFSGDRITIENLTAETGGGKLQVNGFVGLGVEGTYQLRAKAAGVRVRYPEGMSTSLDAALNWTGTAKGSTLAGTVTVLRSAVNPRLDFAQLLAGSSRPLTTPASQNELLRNMQFDLRIVTAPGATFETTLTRDIQAEADLRLRGTPYRPVLLGRLALTQGEISFLGNRYFINRGEISFVNPVRLEPLINLDLETRIRGVDVTLTLSGAPTRLSVTYRSDPPLQTNEIIALLAVGRAPSSDPTLAARQAELDQSWAQVGASTLVGQALQSQVAGRLQRFFGVSRIKIDPKLAGVENNPQAQLTLEQQISKDITFTYITNLAKSQQQAVRVEWNLTREWSILAVRDENGLFGVDVLYRKQFK
jgi:translocation and assembly module TamB